MGTLKIRLRVGDRELEIEGPEASVEKHAEAWAKRLSLDRAQPAPAAPIQAPSLRQPATASDEDGPDLQAIAKQIQADSRWELIYDRIIRQRPAVTCELVPLLFGPKEGLTASQIAQVLTIIGRPFKPSNVIRDLPGKGSKYLTRARSSRGTQFMLNSTGRSYLEDLLKA